jgi:hypothetical protein
MVSRTRLSVTLYVYCLSYSVLIQEASLTWFTSVFQIKVQKLCICSCIEHMFSYAWTLWSEVLPFMNL